MLSCTEFIPLYSEFFKFLEKKGGESAVMDYWIYLSDTNIGDKTNPNSLAAKCELYGGFEGARAYWGHTLSEEACDTYNIYNPKERYNYSLMRYCPSRGMLNSLKHVEPYHNYCGHCKVIYSRVLEKYGVVYERDHSEIDKARCSEIYYVAGHKPNFDFTKPTPDCIVFDEKREGVKYLHRDFHLIGDHALRYCGEVYGDGAVTEFLDGYAKAFFSPRIEAMKTGGISAVEAWLTELYEIEEASELLKTTLSADTLYVTVEKSPVIEYMRGLGKAPSKYYVEETRTVYKSIAKAAGFGFTLDEYDEETGRAKYRFYKI